MGGIGATMVSFDAFAGGMAGGNAVLVACGTGFGALMGSTTLVASPIDTADSIGCGKDITDVSGLCAFAFCVFGVNSGVGASALGAAF